MIHESEIKCKTCATWNVHSIVNNKCKSCQSPLIEELTEAEKVSIHRRSSSNDLRVPINPEDTFLTKVGKHLFNSVQVVFMAVLSFFFWIIAMTPG